LQALYRDRKRPNERPGLPITIKNPASAGAQTTSQKNDDKIACLSAELFNSIHAEAAIKLN
jgi:hypothetical protein